MEEIFVIVEKPQYKIVLLSYFETFDAAVDYLVKTYPDPTECDTKYGIIKMNHFMGG